MLGLTALVLTAIIILSALRRRLLFEISGTSLLLFRSQKPGLWIYAFIMLPGTILHELSHWIVAEILQVRTGEIKILPDNDHAEEHRLGSVATEKVGALRGILIGSAPFVTGLLVLVGLGYVLDLSWPYAPYWQILALAYGMMVVGSSMFLSPADLRHWPVLAMVVTLMFLVMYYTGTGNYLNVLTRPLIHLYKVLWMTVGISFVMILLLYLARCGLERVMHKKVIR